MVGRRAPWRLPVKDRDKRPAESQDRPGAKGGGLLWFLLAVFAVVLAQALATVISR